MGDMGKKETIAKRTSQVEIFFYIQNTHSRHTHTVENQEGKKINNGRGNASFLLLRNIMYTMNSLDIIFCSPSLMDEAWPNYNSFLHFLFFFKFFFLLLLRILLLFSRLKRNQWRYILCNSSPVVIYREVIWFGGGVWMCVYVSVCAHDVWWARTNVKNMKDGHAHTSLSVYTENTHFQKSPNFFPSSSSFEDWANDTPPPKNKNSNSIYINWKSTRRKKYIDNITVRRSQTDNVFFSIKYEELSKKKRKPKTFFQCSRWI